MKSTKNVKNTLPLLKIIHSLIILQPLKRKIDRAKKQGDLPKEKEAILAATKKWGSYFVKNLKVDVQVEGKENLPEEGSMVFVANHQSYTDIPILCSVLTKVPFGFVAKDSLSKIPFLGIWMTRIRGIMMLREDPRASLKAISEGIENLNLGFSLAIFPEGTRSKSSEMKSFKKGALKLATKPGVPIVPITLDGTYALIEETNVFTPSTVKIIIHPPVSTKDLTKEEERELPPKIEKIIADGLDKIKS